MATLFLPQEMLIRVFLGWLRGGPRHCKMVAIATLEEEDARRPSRERESLVGKRTRIINRIKAALIRLGTRGFKPELLKASQRLGEGHVRAHGGDMLSSYRCRRTRFCCPSRVCPIKLVTSSRLAVAMSAAGLHTIATLVS